MCVFVCDLSPFRTGLKFDAFRSLAVPLITSDAASVSLGERELALVSVCAVLRVDSYVEKRSELSSTRPKSCGFSVLYVHRDH